MTVTRRPLQRASLNPPAPRPRRGGFGAWLLGEPASGREALQLALGNAVVSLVYVLVGAFFADAERGSWLAFLAAMAVSGAFFLFRSRMVRPEK